jgi:hypothetical protein
MAETVIIAGSLAQKARQGGHTWVFLQYLMGFKHLGWDVLFLDRLHPEMCFDETGRPCEIERSANVRYFVDVMQRFGFENSFALMGDPNQPFIGLSRSQVLERTRKAAFLLNIMGFLDDEEILGCAGRRVFLDIDPGFGQMWCDLQLADIFRGHDEFVTIGENIGQADCTVPTCGLRWIASRQPVVLDCWRPCVAESGDITSIGFWRGAYGPIEYRGKTYGLRAHEFRKFAALPRRTNGSFQLAFDINAADLKDLNLLRENEWVLVDPKVIARDPWVYRDYIQRSKAEFMVAKNMYVESRCGWFSDRSICYLASGKPVLAQDTGIRTIYPNGAGLFLFSTLEEAVAGAEEISRDYLRHCQAARAIAEEYFDSNKVLTNLVSKLGAA